MQSPIFCSECLCYQSQWQQETPAQVAGSSLFTLPPYTQTHAKPTAGQQALLGRYLDASLCMWKAEAGGVIALLPTQASALTQFPISPPKPASWRKLSSRI